MSLKDTLVDNLRQMSNHHLYGTEDQFALHRVTGVHAADAGWHNP